MYSCLYHSLSKATCNGLAHPGRMSECLSLSSESLSAKLLLPSALTWKIGDSYPCSLQATAKCQASYDCQQRGWSVFDDDALKRFTTYVIYVM